MTIYLPGGIIPVWDAPGGNRIWQHGVGNLGLHILSQCGVLRAHTLSVYFFS